MSKIKLSAAVPLPVLYDCEKCPAFCCSVYERVAVTPSDLTRLAVHFGISEEEAKKNLTKMWNDERILKRKKDPVLETTCKFLDTKTRGCTIYHARPDACREFPNQVRCPYYDLYQFEREHQDDPTVVPIVSIEFKEWKRSPRIEEAPDAEKEAMI